MKKLLIILISLLPVLAPAQTKNDIFNPKVPMVFFGSDFSQVLFTKAEMFTNQPDILRFFIDCNNYFEEDVFHRMIRNKMNRNEIPFDFSYVNKVNASVDWQKVFSDRIDFRLSNSDIENAILKLNIDQEAYRNHIGLLFCEENFSKTKKLGSVAIVFFNVNDLKPLFIKHLSFKPSGYGFLFYWSSINYYAIKSLGKQRKELK